MGYIAHHAILVTGMPKDVDKIQTKAVEIFGADQVSLLVASSINNYVSFFVAPDGSKEGWDESDIGDQRRDAFVKYLTQSNDCHGPFCYWVEVFYDEFEKKKIVR